MDRTPNNASQTLLLGAIDTRPEIKAILAILEEKNALQRQVTELEITNFLNTMQEWRKNRIDGPVDTPREIAIFFGVLKKAHLLSGPIDTPTEIELFMKELHERGILQQSIATLKPKPLLKPEEEEERPTRKRKRPIDDDYRPQP